MQGWIKLYRRLQDCWIWKSKEPFDRRSAWVDLLLLANHNNSKMLVDNKIILINRGSFLTSILKLSERWMWSRGKINRFLKLLENEQMITTKRTPSGTLITIVNYKEYQVTKSSDDTTVDTTNDTTLETTDGTTSDTTVDTTGGTQKKNDKNVKNDKNEEDIYNSQQWFNSGNKSSYVEIAKLYNEICVDLPKCKLLNKERTNQMKKCIDIMEKTGTNFEMFFRKVQASDFLTGRNRSNSDKWQADFDWIFKPVNCTKIIEGNYDNKLDNYLRY